MTSPHTGFDRRVLGALDASPSRIPVIPGGCGTGRTSLLQRLRSQIGRGAAQYIDVERSATTPERFLQAAIASSPFAAPAGERPPATPREAFDAFLGFLDAARAPGGAPCTFLLDEVLELRTFESFPGLRHVLRDLLEALAASPNRFVLTTRYLSRAHRLLRDATARFEVMHLPPLSAYEVTGLLAPAFNGYEQTPTDDRDFIVRAVLALTGGRPAYVRAIAETMRQMGRGADPVSALTALIAPGGALYGWCRFCYELRLHRARGYGALKAILDILAGDEPLTLTEISLKLHRTPGSTKDYLSWLEDVDLVLSRQKRYSFTDPLLRLWVRLHCRPTPPTDEDVAREIQRYALERVPPRDHEPAPALAYAGVEATPDERKSWGIIEID
ncbi:MAG: hypothetical protein A3H29_19710 [Acidobacteria bacterium RIFCSPLOWO2_02_FULL_67_21]|nr:MAG: hypothetical protein A3H29_19710 [Acidobacteria bacterium RIFCSPLOWO2_02_FULL_67_21]